MPNDGAATLRLTTRQRLIISGLYLSKFDLLGLQNLGFENFAEAFNVIGYALGSKPASVKNYRDEFDPIFPNSRKGWHKRPTREYCLEMYERFKDLDFDSFTGLVKSFFGFDQNLLSQMEPADARDDGTSIFAQRLITGVAAECYFESVHKSLPEFEGYSAENTTRFGCGYDFRLWKDQRHDDFLAVEVKGLKAQTGSLLMTPKEYNVASALGERFYLFVVKNFRETPSHSVFKNPLSCTLQFKKAERTLIQVSWVATV
ncbi:MAG TPA: DUF3883 domain-containing protein [Terracidiphilus sp.]|jgi:hypothetical protein|nr:DUF3883 domain-containing protein [Terracidiphilus sp.]